MALKRLEQTHRTYIETSALSKRKARKIVEELDSSTPFRCRFEFVEALAALSTIFGEDMARKVPGANKGFPTYFGALPILTVQSGCLITSDSDTP